MILFKKATVLRNWLETQSKKANAIGFIPTMGALHEGHISLIRKSTAANTITVCSIFINPTQFNNEGDFQKYPVTIEKDIDMLEAAGCDVLFLPAVKEMYPEGVDGGERYELGYLEKILEGKFRPGHFQGVCMIVDRLLDIVRPSRLYLGQKDYQQCMVIKKLLDLTNKNETELEIAPTLREKDGLAMSSRNMRLTKEERSKAVAISKALFQIKNDLRPGKLSDLKKKAIDFLEAEGFKVDYVEIADAADLSIVNDWDGTQPVVVLVAAFIGDVRLIDNLIV